MLAKYPFILAHEVMDPSFYHLYKQLNKQRFAPREDLVKKQEIKLRELILFCYDNVPYYHTFMKDNKIFPDDIKSIEDLNRFPLLTKQTIKDNWEDFKPKCLNKIRYNDGSTGGTTGTPFRYRFSKKDWMLGGCLLYRGWGYGGYNLGDKMVFMGGSSIGINDKSFLNKIIHERLRNIRKCSSFEMNNDRNLEYTETILKFRPGFIRGYPSSIHHYAKWLQNNGLTVAGLKSIFTTSEKLFDRVRNDISEIFGCDVFDGYGLNDGGLSAFECTDHSGMHIDTERSILEVINETGNCINDGEGSIVATSLSNLAMPFIRYDTGDVGSITSELCNCGMQNYKLDSLTGRSVDMLQTPEGTIVHGWFFLYIFWEYGKNIKEYQIIQRTIGNIDVYYVPEESFRVEELDIIQAIIHNKSPGWIINFKEVSNISRTKAGKFKFIINEMIQ